MHRIAVRRPGFHIRILLVVTLLGLSGCGEVPIRKTNCWSTAPAQASATVSRNAADPMMLISVTENVPPKHDAVCV